MLKILVSGPILAPLVQIWVFQSASMDFNSLDVRHFEKYHSIQFQGKLMNQNWENSRKPSFMPDFGPLDQNSGTIFFFKKSDSLSH